ncbi:MAG: hypothetical protein HY262_04205 [Chloroflexi bacterium]|nr:hypothetical protein [Chloroflexota bacterium]
MASTETRPSFRLPWSTGPAEAEALGEPEAVPAEIEQPESEPPEARSEASMARGDMDQSEETQAPDMIETAAPAASPSQSEPSGAAPARRATKFMAELSHAMQAAAEHARTETMERFQAEAKAVVEEIRTSATTEVADLRRRADDDVAAIREWSKAEIARIREETEARVAARKTGLDAEMEAHAATVETRAERVAAVVAAFEAEMGAFFDRLNAEEDPTRIATMAETMPDPPSLEAVAASTVITQPPAVVPAETDARPEPAPEPAPTAEVDFAAAEAEALSFDGDLTALGDLEEVEPEPMTGSPEEAAEAAEPDTAAEFEAGTDAQTSTRVIVAGLISVASIANFKRSLARIPGVWSIGVSSGPEGDFVFTVSHNGSLSLPREIESMSAFDSQITGEAEGEIRLSTHDRDAVD